MTAICQPCVKEKHENCVGEEVHHTDSGPWVLSCDCTHGKESEEVNRFIKILQEALDTKKDGSPAYELWRIRRALESLVGHQTGESFEG